MKLTVFKKFTAWFLTLAVLMTFMPGFTLTSSAEGTTGTSATRAGETNSGGKTSLNQAGYEALGFSMLGLEVPKEDIFGPGGNTVMFEQKELLFNYNGSSNYGKLLRDNVNLYQNIDPNNLSAAGAIQLYGQYRNDDWSHLNGGNGYNNGSLGGTNTSIVKNTGNTHQLLAYSTSVEFNNGSGKNDYVARVKVSSSQKRSEQNVVLEIYSYEGGVETRKGGWYVSRGNSTAKTLAREGVWRNHEFDSLIEVTAGDYDGDGKDEIAVYGANNEIKIYKYSGGLKTWKTISVDRSGFYKNADDGLGSIEMAAAVTMASGDLNKDYTDELAIAVSMPLNSSSSKFHSNNNLFIYSFDRKTGTSASDFKQAAKISLSDGTNVMDAANVAIGDMTGNGHKELVVAGWKATGASERSSTIMALHVEYKRSNNTYTSNSFQTIELEDTAPDKKGSTALYNAPPGVAVVNMGGLTGATNRIYVFINNFLYNYDTGTKRYEKVTGGDIEFLTKQKNNADENTDKDETWISKIITGNFSGSEDGKETLIAVIGQRESGGNNTEHWYYYSIAYIAPNGTDGFYKGCEGVVNQARSYINRTDKSRASVFLDLCSPNTDDDSLLLKYKGAEAYYSKPEVQAILQSAPYFQDVADSFDNYLDDGSTGYGTAKGSSSGGTASVSAALGAYTDNEVQLGGSGQFELEVRATVSYDHESSLEVTTSREFMGNAGDDYVVMYTIPYYRYWYDAYDPGTKKTYEMKIEEPLTPATVIVPVETYDEIAEQYSGLEKIRGNVLKSTPGDPYSYEEWALGNFEAIGDVQMLTNAGVQSGSLVTVSQESVDSETNSFSVGIEENLKVGAGVGFVGNKSVTGVSQSLSVAGGGVFSNMSGVAYTGSVDNLPAGVSGYGFNWQFGISEIEFNGETVIVVGYQTSNVKSGPKAPKNLNITDISSTSMSLEWEGTDDASVYEVAIVSNDMELPLATIPATDVDDDGMVRFTANELSPNRQYTFRVTASNTLGIRSVAGQDAVGTTLPENSGNFMITAQPVDRSAAPGHTAVFEVAASSTNKGAIGYQWQYYDEEVRAWMTTGSNTASLSVTASANMDGRRYRCVVYQGDYLLRSKTVTLTVNKSPTSTSLTVKKGTEILAEGSYVKANDLVTVPNETDVVRYSKETVIIGGATYTRYGIITSEDGGEAYKASNYWLKEGTESFYIVDDAKTTVTAVTVKELHQHSYNSEYFDVDVDAVDVAEVTIKAAEGENPAVTSVSAYQVADGRKIYIASDGKNYIHNGTEYAEFGTVQKGNAADATMYIKDGSVYTARHELVEYFKTETVKETQYTQETRNGDVITLISDVSETDGKVSDQPVVFSITDKEMGTVESVTGTLKNGRYEAEYTFPNTGVYGVVAIYPGSNTYTTSRSDETVIYATGSGSELVLGGGTITYGDSLQLKPAVLKSDGTVDENITVSYTNIVCDGATRTVAELIKTGNTFVPDKAGSYVITAAYEGMTTTTVVTVDCKQLTLRPDDVQTGINDTEKTSKMTMTVEDGILGEGDYILYSRATGSNQVGEYPIYATLTTQGQNKVSGKYMVCVDPGTYILTTESYEIIGKAGANGSVQINYSIDGGNPIVIPSGTRVPEGATVVIIAQPDSGYGVSSWKIDAGNPTSNEGKALSKTFENISGDVKASVTFGHVFSTLYFESSNEDHGTVTGKYTGSDMTFISGDSLNVNQAVTLTAEPKDGYVIAKWTRYNGNTNETETVTNSDGTNYTGKMVEVKGINSAVEYKVYFEAEKALEMTFAVYDSSYGTSVNTASVLVNGEALSKNSDGKFVYSGYEHQNVEIEIEIPANMLVDYWSLNTKPVYDSVTEVVLNDISGAYEFAIYCITPNGRTVTFSAALEGTNGGTTDGSVFTAKRISGDDFTSGTTQPQGAALLFTATPADGYRVNRIVVVDGKGNETKVSGVDVTTYQITLDLDLEVKAYFEKKPIVTFTNTTYSGEISAQVGSGNVANGEFVEFDSDVQVNIIPHAGYVVDTVTVTDKNGTRNMTPVSAGGKTDAVTITLEDIQLDTTVTAAYKNKPVVTFASDANGVVSVCATKDFEETNIVSGSYVDFGTKADVIINPNDGYVVDTVKINGAPVDFKEKDEKTDTMIVNVENVQKNNSIEATFKAKPIITFEQPENGAVVVKAVKDFAETEITSGSYVDFGTNLTITINPETGYYADVVTAGGKELFRDSEETYTGGTETVTFTGIEGEEGVLANTAVKVVCKAKPIVSVIAENASVTINQNDVALTTKWIEKYSGNLSFKVVPNGGYELTAITTTNNYTQTFENAAENDTVIVDITDDKITHNVDITFMLSQIPTYDVSLAVEKIDEEDDGYHGTVLANVTRKSLDFYTDTIENSSEGVDGAVYRDSKIRLVATPAEGYRVQSWTVNGEVQESTSNTYILNVTNSDFDISVRFIKTVTGISFGPTDSEDKEGYISEAMAGGTSQLDNAATGVNLSEGATIAFAATPKTGYEVEYWMANGEKLNGTDGLDKITYTSTGTGESVYIEPHFIQIEYTITTSVSNGTMSVTPALTDGKARGGENLIFTVVPNSGYKVAKWRVNGKEIEGETSAALVWTVPNGAAADPAVSEYEIQAVMDRGSYKITYSAGENGSVSSSTTNGEYVESGTSVTVTAVADTGYHLDYWKVNGKKSDEVEKEITVCVDVDTTVEAVFAVDMIDVTFGTEGNSGKITAIANGKAISSGSKVAYGSELKFTAQPAGEDMVNVWKVNGTSVEETRMTDTADAPLAYTINAITVATDVKVEFVDRPVYVVTATKSSNGVVAITGDTEGLGYIEVKRGGSVEIAATADEYYQLKGWKVNSIDTDGGDVLAVIGIKKDTTIEALFMEAVGYNVTLTVNDTSGASPEVKVDANGVEINPGSTAATSVSVIGGKRVTVTITPTEESGRSNMMIKKWTVNGEHVTDENAEELGVAFADGEVSCSLSVVKLLKNTDITVDIVPYEGVEIPGSGDGYTVEINNRTPVYSKPETEIVKGGNVTFTVIPDENMGITKLEINDVNCLEKPTEGDVTAVSNEDGSWTVTVVNVEELNAAIVSEQNTHKVTIQRPTNGVIIVDNNGNPVISGTSVAEGTNLTISAVPDTGYSLMSLKVNGVNITSGSAYTLKEDITIEAAFTTKSGPRGGGGGGGSVTHTVTFETNGGSEIEKVKVTNNNAVKEPTSPTKEGYIFGDWFTDEELTTVYDFGSKVTKNITLYAKWEKVDNEETKDTDTHICPSKEFNDLDVNAWYHLDVDYVIENEIFRGVTETTFAPDEKLTRAMLVTVLYRVEGEPATNRSIPFEDVDMGVYYANAVVWAQQNGIVKGISETKFAPDDNITREQIAAIMHRYAQYKGYDVSVGENTNILSYDDVDGISEYAIASMQYAVGSGLMKGKTASTLNPKDSATRAETAAILHRFLESNK